MVEVYPVYIYQTTESGRETLLLKVLSFDDDDDQNLLYTKLILRKEVYKMSVGEQVM